MGRRHVQGYVTAGDAHEVWEHLDPERREGQRRSEPIDFGMKLGVRLFIAVER